MSTDSNYVYAKGTLFVAPGGGAAPSPLLPGVANQALFANPASALGVEWGAGTAMGDVVGPGSSVAHNLAAFADTTGLLLEDSGVATANVALGAGSSVMGNVMSFASTDGKTIADSGISAALVAIGPGTSTGSNFPAFVDTDGVTLEDSGFSSASFRPAFVTGGSAPTKGSFTLSSGTHAKIDTTAAVTGCIIVFTVVSLGTVTVASSFLATIANGTGFTPVASQATDTSVVNWAILG